MEHIDASPTKKFFVEMLVRDIELKDALLDLLDNCVDGAMRTLINEGRGIDGDRPYDGFWAKINFSENEFSIEDNCGGIPRAVALSSAFRLGRPSADLIDDHAPTVGVYGIGMKRAIFKLGERAIISSRHANEAFEVDITPEWMASDKDWKLNLIDRAPLNNETSGTHVIVNDLRDHISSELAEQSFHDSFVHAVAQYYGFIIQKGFKVEVKGVEVEPDKIGFVIDKESVHTGTAYAPYVYYKAPTDDGVEVTMAVGFYKDLPSIEEEEDQEQQEREGRPTSEQAGWTIIVNDRVVLYADKTRVTGWDEAGVPAYHTQFTSIAGLVIFRSDHPEKLPITTTKRGVDGNSELYLAVKNHMRDGLKLFTNFTNIWKKAPEQRDALRTNGESLTIQEVLKVVRESMRQSRREQTASTYVPTLPTPTAAPRERWIRFRKPIKEVEYLSKFFFDEADVAPSVVGEKAFGYCMEKASTQEEKK